MDLVAQMLLVHLERFHSEAITPTRVCAPFHRRFTRLGNSPGLFTADRFLNRWRDYPRFVETLNGHFDLYHVVDHSYSHLLHHLPLGPAVVTCHDLDAFRCLIEPDEEPRVAMFKKVSQYILTGLQKANWVVCVSESTRDHIVSNGLFRADRLSIVPIGVHPLYSQEPDARADSEADRLLGPRADEVPEVLHVGSTIPRKRIDLLLRVCAELRKVCPHTRLIRVGGPFTKSQAR